MRPCPRDGGNAGPPVEASTSALFTDRPDRPDRPHRCSGI